MTTRSALSTTLAASRQRNPFSESARRRRLGALALAVPPVLLLTACTSEEAAPVTVKVARASVTSTVTATGSLQAITEQRLGFPDSGKLVELNAAVGQQVESGQILARLDDFPARKELEASRAQVAQESAALARIRDSNQVSAAEEDVERAQAILDATEEQADAVDGGDTAVEHAERQLAEDEEDLEEAEERAGCGEDGLGDEYCEENADVEAAERRVHASEAALERAEQQRGAEEAQTTLAIENARRDLADAEHKAEAARSDHPHNIDEQAAVVSRLQVDVDTALRSVENTVLRAPAAGRITSINGVVGEFIGGGTGTTPLAPGGTVPLPDEASRVSSGDDVGDGDGLGSSAFMVLDNVDTFQIVAPFAEADAARLQPSQQVQVTFDAVPDLARTGTVTNIAPTGTDIQGVTSYYATIVLNELDPRLTDGQTASAHVIVDQLDNTLVVPNAAIQQSGQTGVVTVLEPDGSHRQVQVELGLAGDSVTQVVSGLAEGQQVVVAQGE